MSGISKSQVSRLCEEIDERVESLPRTPDRGGLAVSVDRDATYVKVRAQGRIVFRRRDVAVGVNNDGRREVLGMDIRPVGGPRLSGPPFLAQAREAGPAVGSSLSFLMLMKAPRPPSRRCDGQPGKGAAFTSCVIFCPCRTQRTAVVRLGLRFATAFAQDGCREGEPAVASRRRSAQAQGVRSSRH